MKKPNTKPIGTNEQSGDGVGGWMGIGLILNPYVAKGMCRFGGPIHREERKRKKTRGEAGKKGKEIETRAELDIGLGMDVWYLLLFQVFAVQGKGKQSKRRKKDVSNQKTKCQGEKGEKGAKGERRASSIRVMKIYK